MNTMSIIMKVGLTGMPKSGKTYTIIKVGEMLAEQGWVVGGMVTEAIMEGRKRLGFRIRNWRTGESQVFAHREFTDGPRVEEFGVRPDVLDDIGVRGVREALEECDIVLIDEVGKMEVESQNFVQVVKDTIELEKPAILTFPRKSRNPLLQDIRRKDNVRTFEVTDLNRNILPFRIVKLFKEDRL